MFFSQNRWPGYAFIAFLYISACAFPAFGADPVISKAPATISADSVFVQMTTAWEDGNEKIMAALVHRDGLRVTHGGDYERFTTYSPDQAFYYFQDLFQSRETKDFSFRRLPDPPDGKRGLGMVEWTFLLTGRSNSNSLKYVIVLLKQDHQWRLSEFNSISQR